MRFEERGAVWFKLISIHEDGLKVVTSLWLSMLITVSLMVVCQTAQGGFWETVMGKASESTQEISSSLRQKTEKVREKTREATDNLRGRAQRIRDSVQQSNEQSVESLQRTTSDWGKAFQTKSTELREAWEVHEPQVQEKVEGSLEKVQGISNNRNKIQEITDKCVHFKRTLELTTIKFIPVADPDTGSVVTFDHLMRKMADELEVKGSLGDDPLAAAYLMMVDTEYLLNGARVINTGDGKYLTIREALGHLEGSDSAEAKGVRETFHAYQEMHACYRRDDQNGFNQANRQFMNCMTRHARTPIPELSSPCFEENWESGTPTLWKHWGHPRPVLVNDAEHNGGEAIDLNGDNGWGRGLVSYPGFDLNLLPTLSSYINPNSGGKGGGQYIMIGWTETSAQSWPDDGSAPSGPIWFKIAPENRSWVFCVGTESISQRYDPSMYENTWHRYEIILNPDKTVSFAVDRTIHWTSQNRAALANCTGVHIFGEGRSVDTRILLDDITVTVDHGL